MTPTFGALQAPLQPWAPGVVLQPVWAEEAFCSWGSGHADPGASRQGGSLDPRAGAGTAGSVAPLTHGMCSAASCERGHPQAPGAEAPF